MSALAEILDVLKVKSGLRDVDIAVMVSRPVHDVTEYLGLLYSAGLINKKDTLYSSKPKKKRKIIQRELF